MFRVEDFGAKADDGTDCTEAIQRAIDQCSSTGGGTVVLSEGTYLSGTLRVASDVEFRVETGSTLKAIDDQDVYPEIPNMFIDGTSNTLSPERKGFAFVYTYRARNVVFCGGGTIDVGGDRFEGQPRRPFLMRIIESEAVRIEDITLTQSAAWSCHLQKSNDVTLKNVTLRASGVRNGDGVDIDSSSSVLIDGCDIRTGDDAVCCKSTFGDPCTDIEIRNSTLESHCSGFKIGTESVGDFRNISVSDCVIENCGVVAIKITAVDGGSVENVNISNVEIKDSTGPIFIANGNRKRRYMDSADPGRRSSIRDIRFRDMKITTKRYVRTTQGRDVTDYGQGIVLSGNPDLPLKDISFQDVSVAFWGGVENYERQQEDIPYITDQYPECHQLGVLPTYGYFLQYTEGVTFERCTETLTNPDVRPVRWERGAS
jgi:polygalacturonase